MDLVEVYNNLTEDDRVGFNITTPEDFIDIIRGSEEALEYMGLEFDWDDLDVIVNSNLGAWQDIVREALDILENEEIAAHRSQAAKDYYIKFMVENSEDVGYHDYGTNVLFILEKIQG